VTATDRAVELAHNIIAFDVSDVLAITDAFLVASAPNDRQVKAIADGIEEALREQLDAKPVRREGEREGRWILLDFLDIVVHVQHAEERSYYGLERLWKDCPEIALPEDAVASRNRPDEELYVREPNEFDHVEAVLQAEADRSVR
jgi:ribosome-associated protein